MIVRLSVCPSIRTNTFYSKTMRARAFEFGDNIIIGCTHIKLVLKCKLHLKPCDFPPGPRTASMFNVPGYTIPFLNKPAEHCRSIVNSICMCILFSDCVLITKQACLIIFTHSTAPCIAVYAPLELRIRFANCPTSRTKYRQARNCVPTDLLIKPRMHAMISSFFFIFDFSFR